jgi:3-dehydroquinate synthase
VSTAQPSAIETIRVELGVRGYDICVGDGLLAAAGARIAPFIRRRPTIVITDRNVAALHLDPLTHALAGQGIESASIVVEPGEGTKTFSGFERLADAILDLRPERRSTLIALGGGVIGDLVGFAASVVLRGIDFVQIPTTLLAQVDSSVGGKTGIDTRHGKNLIGSFYQPRLVLADMGTLNTLPRRELLAGYAEVVKYGLLGDAAFFAWLEQNGPRLVAGDAEARRRAVTVSCRAKAAIVAEDEREEGRRALLNLGHTFGHALEAETGFGAELLHGEAVAIGMTMAFDLSVRLGLCPAADAARVRRHLAAVGLPSGLDSLRARRWSAAALIDHMRQDKKVRDGRIAFVLARGIGQAFVAHEVDIAEVEALLERAVAA